VTQSENKPLKFDVNALDSRQNMLFAARLSHLAYLTEDNIKAQIALFGEVSEKVHFIHGKRLFGFVARFPGFAFIAFRGTQTAGDWLDNLDIRFARTHYGYVHYGFARCLKSISHQVIPEVKASFEEPQKVFLTGHSKGGALAVLATAVLTRYGYQPTALYTFGQPMVGDKTFAQWWDANAKSEFFRVVHGRDIVTRMPPNNLRDLGSVLLAPIALILLFLKHRRRDRRTGKPDDVPSGQP